MYLLLFLWVFFLPPLPKGRGTAAQAVVEGYIPQSFAYGEIQPPLGKGAKCSRKFHQIPYRNALTVEFFIRIFLKYTAQYVPCLRK